MAAVDPHYDDVALLLHFDDDAGMVLVDNSPRPKSVSLSAYDIGLTNAEYVFGGASLAASGRGGRASVDEENGDFGLGFGDFTVELWINTSSTKEREIIQTGAPGAWWALALNDGLLQWSDYYDIVFAGSTPVNDGLWHHVAVTRASGVFRLFVDGVEDATAITSDDDNALRDYSELDSVAVLGRMASSDVDLYVDELRITKGVARYTEDFTVPTEAFYHAVIPGWMAAADGPLGAPSAVAVVMGALALAPSPIGQPRTLAKYFRRIGLHAGAAGPLGAACALAARSADAIAAAPSPLGRSKAAGYHDFTASLGDDVTLFVMDLITPGGTVRAPISSWQATLQTGSSNYVQCVVPACTMWQEAINAATEFVIYRRAVLVGGAPIEHEMARAPAEQLQFARGPRRHTCTLSGYSDAFAVEDDIPTVYDRTLTGVRSISSGSSFRVRCSVDWLLRPGHRALVSGAPFVVKFINYYAPSEWDCYMDVGG